MNIDILARIRDQASELEDAGASLIRDAECGCDRADSAALAQLDHDTKRLAEALDREDEGKSFDELLVCARGLYGACCREVKGRKRALRDLARANARGGDYRERMRMACATATAILESKKRSRSDAIKRLRRFADDLFGDADPPF
jgi:phage-related minor tail protein